MTTNPIALCLNRFLTRLGRIGHRCGYGVHSPFAFDFITRVIYERTPYYAYAALQKAEKSQAPHRGKDWNYEPRRIKRLLFRIVNYAQPSLIADAGRLSASSLYLQAACRKAGYTGAGSLDELFLEAGEPVDFLYLHHWQQPGFVEEVFRICVPRTTGRSVFVVEGIGYSRPMREVWRRMLQDPHVVVSFDLHDLGILFFDPQKNRQDYTVFY